ncbi:hypothetical protein PR048_030081, partial [Dryococelus australis]
MPLFRKRHKFPSLEQGATELQSLILESCLFCEAERSFSGRLKTYLRNTMTQKRLNSLILCHIHKEELDRLNSQSLCTEFTNRSDVRKTLL